MRTSPGVSRGGPWPAWLRWYSSHDMDRMGPANDYRIWIAWHELFLAGNGKPGQLVANRFGISRETVRRAMIRERQREEGRWPPKIPNGFGMSAEERRRAILRAQGYALQEDGTALRLEPGVEKYQVQVPDQDDEDGQGWDQWQG